MKKKTSLPRILPILFISFLTMSYNELMYAKKRQVHRSAALFG